VLYVKTDRSCLPRTPFHMRYVCYCLKTRPWLNRKCHRLFNGLLCLPSNDVIEQQVNLKCLTKETVVIYFELIPQYLPIYVEDHDRLCGLVQKLALTWPTIGGRSVGIVRSWTRTMELLRGISNWVSGLTMFQPRCEPCPSSVQAMFLFSVKTQCEDWTRVLITWRR
jgi:hypothetical protein